jgi:uncharacterized repeat protein (TIGR01451 family)
VIAGSGAGNLVYTVEVTNPGTTTAPGVEVTEVLVLPPGVTLVSAIATAGTFDGTVWTVGSLPPLGAASLAITLTAGAAAASGPDAISGVATITGVAGALVDTDDDTDGDSTSVVRQVDLQLAVADSADPVFAGGGAGNLVYTVTLVNAGPSNASDIVIDHASVLPEGATLDQVDVSAGSWAPPFWTLPALDAGDSATLEATITVGAATAPGVDVLEWSASVDDLGELLVLTGDDTASELTTVREPPLFVDGFESGDTSSWSLQRPPP